MFSEVGNFIISEEPWWVTSQSFVSSWWRLDELEVWGEGEIKREGQADILLNKE
jgi:hypothetical protein